MSFKNLPVDELRKIAEYFVIDVEGAANPESPTKKELLAAFAAGDEPLTFEHYKEFYKEEQAPKEEEVVQPVEKESKPVEPIDTSNYQLIKFTGQNASLEIVGYTFSQRHPYRSVPPEVAEHLVLNHEGFRLALASEVNDYYN